MSMLTPRGVGGRLTRRRRGLGRMAGLLVVLLVLVAVGGVWWFTVRDSSEVTAKPQPTCPAPSPTPTVVPPGQVTVNVYNATQRRGLAARVAAGLKKRGFKIAKIDNDPLERKVTGVAEVRSGGVGKDAARTVAAQVGDVVALPDQRPGPAVDLVLGARFTGLRSPVAAAAAIRPTPQPRPPGC